MSHVLIWTISAVSILFMLLRPFRLPEYVWAGGGALLLSVFGLISPRLAGRAVAEGLDVYLFLAGMMLLSELAKEHGVFDWLARLAVGHARGSSRTLFTWIYGVGAVVTVFMSNDATAVVLTPAVLTALKRARAHPRPYLLACAMIANAASFVLPISNPANLVVFGTGLPTAGHWLRMFLVPSLGSIIITYALLGWLSRKELEAPCSGSSGEARLSPAGKTSLYGIMLAAMVLMGASALNLRLGLPTCLAALLIVAAASLSSRTNPVRIVAAVSWSVLPLVAALFVIVEAVKTAGAMDMLRSTLERMMGLAPPRGALAAGAAIAFGTDLFNNLPLGLLSGSALAAMPNEAVLARVVLIAIDLGPNLSITGSLATILWLIALRREGIDVTAWEFLKAGIIIMPASLLAALVLTLAF